MGRKFEDGGNVLPVGTHQPCKLVDVTWHEPSEENLVKWPDMKPSWGFLFRCYKPNDDELHEASAACFCTDTLSKLGKLFQFCTDLAGGVHLRSLMSLHMLVSGLASS